MIGRAWPVLAEVDGAVEVAATVAELAGTVLLVLAAAALAPLLLALAGRGRPAQGPDADASALDELADDADRREVSPGVGR